MKQKGNKEVRDTDDIEGLETRHLFTEDSYLN